MSWSRVITVAAFAIATAGCGKQFTVEDTGAGGSAQGGDGGAVSAGGDGAGGDKGECQADLDIDPNHCGACFHDCLGGACEDGKCQPVEVVAGQDNVVGIAISQLQIYWAVSGEIWRESLAGGNRAQLLATGNVLRYLAIDNGRLYWTVANNGEIQSCSIPQCSSATVITDKTGLNQPTGLAINGSTFSWSQFINDGCVMFYDGVTEDSLQCGIDRPEGVASRGNRTYWAANGDDTINYVDEGVGVFVLAPNERNPAGVAVDGDYVYWGNQSDGSIMRISPSGGTPEQIATSVGGQPTGIAVTDDAIYWADSQSGSIVRLAK